MLSRSTAASGDDRRQSRVSAWQSLTNTSRVATFTTDGVGQPETAGLRGLGQNGAVDDRELVDALRAKDEAAFREVVVGYHSAMIRLASFHVSSRAVAEEVVQDTWLAVVKGLDRFEGRSSFKTWVFAILANRARSRGAREHRTVPFSSLEADERTPGVPGERFQPPSDRWAGHWSEPPSPWTDVAAARLESDETRTLIFDAIRSLPPLNRGAPFRPTVQHGRPAVSRVRGT